MTSRIIVITGGTRGIGRATAELFLRNGDSVVITGRSDTSIFDALEEMKPYPGKVFGHTSVLDGKESADSLLRFVQARLGRADVLVNNAGLWTETPFSLIGEDEFESHISLLKGTFFLSQAFANYWVKERHIGAIVNVGSIWGERAIGRTPCSAHAITKAGIHQLTRNVSQELGCFGIRVNTVAPGVINSESRAMADIHALRRNGSTDDVAQMIFYLADQEKAGWITGSIFHVDGGASALIDNRLPNSY